MYFLRLGFRAVLLLLVTLFFVFVLQSFVPATSLAPSVAPIPAMVIEQAKMVDDVLPPFNFDGDKFIELSVGPAGQFVWWIILARWRWWW